jgi:hypothetical protein
LPVDAVNEREPEQGGGVTGREREIACPFFPVMSEETSDIGLELLDDGSFGCGAQRDSRERQSVPELPILTSLLQEASCGHERLPRDGEVPGRDIREVQDRQPRQAPDVLDPPITDALCQQVAGLSEVR